MPDSPNLGQMTLGFSPVLDAQRAVVATRLTVFPDRLDAVPDVAALLQALDAVWPAPPAAAPVPGALTLAPLPGKRTAGPPALPTLLLNLAGEGLLRAVLAAAPAPHRLLEVPAFMAADASVVPLLAAQRAAGVALLIKGQPTAPLAPDVLAHFSHVLVEPGADANRPSPALAAVYAGVRTAAGIEAALKTKPVAVAGWPADDAPPKPGPRRTAPPDVQAVMALIDGVNKERPVSQLEPLLKRDPALAFRLMRYLNSPAFGLSVEVNSLGHALMLLGYGRLKRWLALLLASSSKDANAKPLLWMAVRRGLLMEELVRPQGDSELGGEMFICGVFSLLDRLLQQPLSEVLQGVIVPERVEQALLRGAGPAAPYLALVRALESEAVFDIRERIEELMLGPAEVNRALLAALATARQLD